MEQQGFTVWFTGLSGSGKNTIARLVADELRRRGLRVELLATSEFRQNISQGLGFSREDRIANIRRIGYVAKLLSRNGVAVITTAVSPYREARNEVRRQIENFIEVFVNCPVEICEQRDRVGKVGGISVDYEPPLRPEIVLHSANQRPEVLAAKVLAELEQRGWAGVRRSRSGDPDEAIVRAQLRALHER